MGLRQTSRNIYRHVKDGMRTVDAIVHKAALVYSLTHPLLNQAYDTRAIDSNLMDSYTKYQQARAVGSQIDRIIN